MQDQNNKIEERLNGISNKVVALETTQGFILAELKEIRKDVSNHLTDVRSDISDIKKQQSARPSWMISILLTGMSSIIVALIVFSLK